MKAATAWSTERDARTAAAAALAAVRAQLGGQADLLLVYGSVLLDSEGILERVRREMPGTPVFGGTSCLGVMTEKGFHSDAGHGLGMLGIRDPRGCYGVGHAELGGRPRQAALEAVRRALDASGRPGEIPRLVLLCGAPGREEAVLEGIADAVGPEVPIIGGSAGDNTVEGFWRQVTLEGVHRDAVVVAVAFPSSETSFAFHSGYMPTDREGIATRTEGRMLFEIDGCPAAEVYDEWTGGAVSSLLEGGGNALALTALQPLGRPVTTVGGVAFHCLAHPEAVTPDRALSLFADVHDGDRLVLMSGTTESLITRAGRVAASALAAGGLAKEQVEGALVFYCAGCMLAVQESMEDVVGGLREAMPGVPFLGAFTFGEQGCLLGEQNRHGNLMISVVTFAKDGVRAGRLR